MTETPSDCILALDLGTSSFKAAWVDRAGTVGPVTSLPYPVDTVGGCVTCPPDRYRDAAIQALRLARRTAASLHPVAIGITSQAQTFVTLDAAGTPVGPAVVWTDRRAGNEAREVDALLPDYAQTSGFIRPSPLQFFPKVLHTVRHGPLTGGDHRFLLLNEWILQCLTGEAIGDTNNQGMGGFWDIQAGQWNTRALEMAGIGPQNLARIGPPGHLSGTLTETIQEEIELGPIPVYSCGNDQSCAAVGAGLREPGDLLFNFGTAMVAYRLSDRPIAPATDAQIAGVAPLPDRWFLLSDLEFLNVLDSLYNSLPPGQRMGDLLRAALAQDFDRQRLPDVKVRNGAVEWTEGREPYEPVEITRAVLEDFLDRFEILVNDLKNSLGPVNQILAAGGWSRCRDWVERVESRYGIRFQSVSTPYPGLRGVAKIITQVRGGDFGTPV